MCTSVCFITCNTQLQKFSFFISLHSFHRQQLPENRGKFCASSEDVEKNAREKPLRRKSIKVFFWGHFSSFYILHIKLGVCPRRLLNFSLHSGRASLAAPQIRQLPSLFPLQHISPAEEKLCERKKLSFARKICKFCNLRCRINLKLLFVTLKVDLLKPTTCTLRNSRQPRRSFFHAIAIYTDPESLTTTVHS